MEKMIQERACAKVNLTLGVTGRRSDGYHTLDSLMVTTDLCDDVTVTRCREVIVTCTGMFLPYRNTLRAAAERYRALTGRGARIHVYKRIPVEAGLGGGSADAAAVLRGMQRLYGEAEERDLYDIALRVGADVPFCLQGGLCRAQGVGEVLTPFRLGAPLHLVLAKPAAGVSTRALFERLNLPQPLPDTARAMAALSGGDVRALGPLLCNALQAEAEALVPEIGTLRQRLLALGALGASMTGSGSAVFGLFETAEAAAAACAAIAEEPACAFARVATGA